MWLKLSRQSTSNHCCLLQPPHREAPVLISLSFPISLMFNICPFTYMKANVLDLVFNCHSTGTDINALPIHISDYPLVPLNITLTILPDCISSLSHLLKPLLCLPYLYCSQTLTLPLEFLINRPHPSFVF